jgi:hypothetical protein
MGPTWGVAAGPQPSHSSTSPPEPEVPMNRRPLLALLVAALALSPRGAPAGDGEPFGLMAMGEVERLMARREVAVFDANVPEIWARNHLPGAVHIVGRDLATLLPADRTARLVFYCTSPK